MIKYEAGSMDNKRNAHCCFGPNTQVFGPNKADGKPNM